MAKPSPKSAPPKPRAKAPLRAPIRSEDLETHILETFDSPGYQPPQLPAVALKMLALSHEMEVPFEKVAAVLAQDQMLAAKVIHRAQSAAYGSSGSAAQTLRQAIVRLGLGALRNLVLESALQAKVFRSKEFEGPMERLRCHSIAVAHLAKLVGQRAKVNVEIAYLAGLMHDVGVAGALLVLTPHASVDPAVLWPALGFVHERVGHTLLQLWGLPAEVQQVVADHHGDGAAASALGASVVTAEAAVDNLGCSLFEAGTPEAWNFEVHSAEAQASARRTLRFKDADVEAVGREAAQTLLTVDPGIEKLVLEKIGKRK